MRYIFSLVFLLSVTLSATSQQINPVPDYIFRNSMSVGRNAPTDTAAYFSVGPRYGAVKGMMPPMVIDTASMSGNKRNGLTIFSIQKNKYVYWDSIGAKWAEMAGTAGNALTSADTASLISTRAWRQKGIDSVASVRIGGSGVTGYIPKFTAARTLDSSRIFQNSAGEILINDAADSGDYRLQVNGAILTNRFLRLKSTANDWEISAVEGDTLLTIQSRRPQRKQVIIDTASRIFLGLNANNAGSGSSLALRGRDRKVAIGDDVGGYDVGAFNLQVKGPMHTNNAVAMAVSSGNVSVGSTSSSYKLDVTGTMRSTTSAFFATASGTVGVNTTSATNRMVIGAPLAGFVPQLAFEYSSGTQANAFIGSSTFAHNMFISSNYEPTSDPALPNWATARLTGAGGAIYRQRDGDHFFFGDPNLTASTTYTPTERMRIKTDGEVFIATTTDVGAFALQVGGVTYSADGFRTGAPAGGTAATWKLGTVATVSPTSPNRTIEVSIGGTIYYIHAKTTND
jgi:hypothetical protein